MLYPKEFIAAIKTQPATGVVKACAMAFEKLGAKSNWDDDAYDILSEAYALVTSVIEAKLINIKDMQPPTLRGRLTEDCASLNQYLLAVRKEAQVLVQMERIELLKARTRQNLGVDPAGASETCYRFEVSELTRMRGLVKDMAQVLEHCRDLSPRIQARMARRLADIERDLRESMTDWDRFWGLIGEARLLLSQCGDSARQFVRGFSEMSQIVGAAQVRAAGLPAGHRMALLTLDGHGHGRDD